MKHRLFVHGAPGAPYSIPAPRLRTKAEPDRIGQLAATMTLAGRLVRSPDVSARVGLIDRSVGRSPCARRSDRPKPPQPNQVRCRRTDGRTPLSRHRARTRCWCFHVASADILPSRRTCTPSWPTAGRPRFGGRDRESLGATACVRCHPAGGVRADLRRQHWRRRHQRDRQPRTR
jgi:hypothetical protein